MFFLIFGLLFTSVYKIINIKNNNIQSKFSSSPTNRNLPHYTTECFVLQLPDKVTLAMHMIPDKSQTSLKRTVEIWKLPDGSHTKRWTLFLSQHDEIANIKWSLSNPMKLKDKKDWT